MGIHTPNSNPSNGHNEATQALLPPRLCKKKKIKRREKKWKHIHTQQSVRDHVAVERPIHFPLTLMVVLGEYVEIYLVVLMDTFRYLHICTYAHMHICTYAHTVIWIWTFICVQTHLQWREVRAFPIDIVQFSFVYEIKLCMWSSKFGTPPTPLRVLTHICKFVDKQTHMHMHIQCKHTYTNKWTHMHNLFLMLHSLYMCLHTTRNLPPQI